MAEGSHQRNRPAAEGDQTSKILEIIRSRNLAADSRISTAIIQQSPIGISVRDRNGNLILCNPSWAEIWEKPAEAVEEALNRQKSELRMDNRDDYLGGDQARVREVYEHGGQLVLEAIHVPDIDKWVQQTFYGIQGESGSTDFVVVLTEDVTESRKAEEVRKELHKSVLEYRDMVENLPVAAYTTGADGYCISCNIAMVRMFEETSRDNLLRTPASERYADPSDRIRFIRELVRSGRMQNFEVQLLTCRGRPFWASISATATVRDGEIEYIDGIIRDISSKKALEEEILKNQKLESIGILAGGIAHDFNNIMAAVLGNISLARLYCTGDEKIMEKLDNAERAALRASELTRQLLTFSRGGKPVRKTVDVRNVLTESARFAVTGSSTVLRFDLQDDLRPAEVDESQIGQVVNNLVLNAVQATPAGGEITISARNVELDSKNHFSLPSGRYLRLTFRDAGHGIPQEIQNRIFDPYFTTRTAGSGLGLATVYSIVKNHYGSITVESSPEDGTVFLIHLPSSDHAPVGSPVLSQVREHGRGKVLVMDDELPVREVLSEMLSRYGYTVHTAEDGMTAVDLYGKALADGDPFDVVITDVTVPGGMGGVETARRIHRMNPEARIIVASGYSGDAVMARHRDHGFIDSLDKPFKLSVLLDSVARAMPDN